MNIVSFIRDKFISSKPSKLELYKHRFEDLFYSDMFKLSHKEFYELCIYAAHTFREHQPDTIELWMMRYLGSFQDKLELERALIIGKFLLKTRSLTHAELCAKYYLGYAPDDCRGLELYLDIQNEKAKGKTEQGRTELPDGLFRLSLSAYTAYTSFNYEEAFKRYAHLHNALPSYEDFLINKNHCSTLLKGDVIELLEITRYTVKVMQNYRAARHFIKRAHELCLYALDIRKQYDAVMENFDNGRGFSSSQFTHFG